MNSEQASVPPAPIFILSCERAGSTMLRYIIDTHPEICCPGELHLGQLCEHLAHVVAVLGAAESWDGINAETRRMVSALMGEYAARKGKRLWCEKTPRNVAYAEALREVFPEAKFICLHRHCMDVVHSCLEASRVGFFVEPVYYARAIPPTFMRGAAGHPAAFALSWAEKTKQLVAFERAHTEQCFRVKYEELVADPASVLEPMFGFLGVAWDASILDAAFRTPHDGPGDTKAIYTRRVHTESVGAGASVAPRLIPQDVLENVNGLLTELGYPTVGPDWGQTPSPSLDATRDDEGGERAEAVPDIEEIFASGFPRRLRERREHWQDLGGVYKFVVTGEGGGVWLLDLDGPEARITRGEGEARSTITVASADLFELVTGKLNAARAFELGKVRMAGDLAQVVALGQILLG